MNLNLKLEGQQSQSLHSSVYLALKIAASMPSLERALEVLKAHLNSDRWAVGQSGHHVWASWKSNGEFIRVAMIVEEQS